MANFDSVMNPYRAQYPEYEFYDASPDDDPIQVTTKNPANDKTAIFDMPVPYIEAEMNALVAFSVLQVQ